MLGLLFQLSFPSECELVHLISKCSTELHVILGFHLVNENMIYFVLCIIIFCVFIIVSFGFSESKISKYTEEYELGRKHLANMMGIHPDEMTQEHINVCSVSLHFFWSPFSLSTCIVPAILLFLFLSYFNSKSNFKFNLIHNTIQ